MAGLSTNSQNGGQDHGDDDDDDDDEDMDGSEDNYDDELDQQGSSAFPDVAAVQSHSREAPQRHTPQRSTSTSDEMPSEIPGEMSNDMSNDMFGETMEMWHTKSGELAPDSMDYRAASAFTNTIDLDGSDIMSCKIPFFGLGHSAHSALDVRFMSGDQDQDPASKSMTNSSYGQ